MDRGGSFSAIFGLLPRIENVKKHKLNRSNWNIGGPSLWSDLVELEIVCHNFSRNKECVQRYTLGGGLEQLSHSFECPAIGSTVGNFPEMGILYEEDSITTVGPSVEDVAVSRDEIECALHKRK
ncbi:hypothetical protein Tco_0608542 [Tanacetum coccineum]